MLTKTLKLYLVRPLNTEWQNIYQSLRDMQYNTAKALNYCMNEWIKWQDSKERIKENTGNYPSFGELPKPSKRLYNELRSKYPAMQSKSISEITRKAELKWRADCKEVFYSLSKSLPSFKKTHPIMCSAKQYSVKYDDDTGYIFSAGLNMKDKHKDKKSRTRFLINKKIQDSQMVLLKRIISGEYKKGSCQIGFNKNKNKWFVNISYSFEPEKPQLNNTKICGIDFGVSTAFSCAINNSPETLYQVGGEIERYRKSIRDQRRSVQMQGKIARAGRGKNKKLNPIFRLEDKEKRFKDLVNHRYSKAIIDFAIKNGCGRIQIENLNTLIDSKRESDSDSDYFFLKNWPVYDLIQKIKYKALEKGIEVREIDPSYTSQRCSRCGYISKENRKSQDKFKCCVCEYKAHADMNAAKNISIADF